MGENGAGKGTERYWKETQWEKELRNRGSGHFLDIMFFLQLNFIQGNPVTFLKVGPAFCDPPPTPPILGTGSAPPLVPSPRKL